MTPYYRHLLRIGTLRQATKLNYHSNLRHSSVFLQQPPLSAPPKQVNTHANVNTLQKPCRRTLTTQASAPRPYVDPKLSYVYGRSNEHLIYSTVDRELKRQAEEIGDEIALISHAEGIHASYRRLSQDVDRVSKALIQRFNVQKGDFVGVFAYNSYNWVVVQFACSRIGAILAPINPSNKTRELAYILERGKVKCLFLPGPLSVQNELNDHLGMLQSEQIVAMSRENKLMLRDVILMDGENDAEYARTDAVASQFELANCQLHTWSSTQDNDGKIFDSPAAAEAAGVDEDDACILCPDSVSPDDPFAVYFTSGTTGSPKGACVSHFTVLNNTRFITRRIRQGHPPSWRMTLCTTLPMFHIFAGVLNTMGILVSKNSKIIYSSHKYDISTLVEAICEHQANVTTVTPTMLIDLLTYVETNKISDMPLRFVQSGGASLHPELVARAFKVLPKLEELRNGYGATETGSLATFHSIHEPNETRPFTVGPPIDFTEIRIVNPKTGSLVPHGERGEIQTRGHNIMLEYLDEPAKTAEVLTKNRWYRTGDIGFLHPHGSVQICGRLKHMIIKGGENIYPEEVEKLMLLLDYVEDVHVIGLPDKRFGEQVCACIKLKPGYVPAKTERGSGGGGGDGAIEVSKEEILRFCKDNITYFKVPKYLIFVNEFPLTPTKKVQNHLLIEMSIEKLGLHDQLG